MNFADDFLWGAATSSYQVEGAARQDGRGESIWDAFCRVPGKVYNNHNGNVACDQYHRYQEDIALMSAIGVQAYRFSIAWPRIQPSGRGAVNTAGIDYYKRLTDELHANGITPVATLYHWDLPLKLDEQGGWTHRDTAYRFREYTDSCLRELSERIPMWITLNEPWCVAALGYGMGHHAPGHKSVAEMVQALHHLNLAHGLAAQCAHDYRHHGQPLQIGITLNTGVVRPATRRVADIEQADWCSDESRMYLWPPFGKGYPQRYVEHLASTHRAPLPLEPGDMEQIAQPLDFLGFNYYMEFVMAAAISADGQRGRADTAAARPTSSSPTFQFNPLPQWEATTEMGWHITPAGIYRHLKWIQAEVGDIPIYITENGCATADTVTADGRVHDHQRIAYIREHLRYIQRAIDEGVAVRGYFLWSLIDNFEWGFGYTKRFGMIYCDYATLARIPKDSYYFYRDCIAGYI